MNIKYWALRTTRNTIKCFSKHDAMLDASRNIQWSEKGSADVIICNMIEPDTTLRQLIVNLDEVCLANPAIINHPYLKDTLVKSTENSWEIPNIEYTDWDGYEKLVFEIAKTLLDAGLSSVSFYPQNN